jgi:pre-mRNA-processing factor 19
MCAVSGNVPEEPVCTADGYLFEKRLIEKHLEVGVQPPSGFAQAS